MLYNHQRQLGHWRRTGGERRRNSLALEQYTESHRSQAVADIELSPSSAQTDLGHGSGTSVGVDVNAPVEPELSDPIICCY